MIVVVDQGLVAPPPLMIEVELESRNAEEGEYVYLHASEVSEEEHIVEERK